MEKHLGNKARVTPLDIVRERFVGMRDGTFHLHMGSVANAAMAAEGILAYAEEGVGPLEIRVLWDFYNNPFAYLVRGDSDIKDIYDIKGKRIAFGVHSPWCMEAVRGLLAFVQLTEDDVTIVPFGSWAAINRAVAEGKADVTFSAAESGVVYEIEAAPKSIRWLDMPFEDTEAWSRFLKFMPTHFPLIAEVGVETARGHEMFAAAYTWSMHADADEGLAYLITKITYEQYADFKDLHKMFGFSAPEAQRAWLDMCPLAYHPGAIRYLKEQGIWTAEDDKWNAGVLALEKQYQGAWELSTRKAKEQGLKIDPLNEEWMSLWDKYRGKLKRVAVRL